ncbi:hypothetical protein [Mycobacterium lepromatosis]
MHSAILWLDLTLQRELANVTHDDIVNLAEVSLRMFNNYFTGKS